jgi:hypothetical protein
MSDKILNISLSTVERAFLKKVVLHYRGQNTWLRVDGYTGYNALTYDEKIATQHLVDKELIELKLVPSVSHTVYPMNTQIMFNNSPVQIPLPMPNPIPMLFDMWFRPTEKGKDVCFVEEL